ncbi:hypothetical protein GCM10020258_25700 [Sphingomonas yabuuchiae]
MARFRPPFGAVGIGEEIILLFLRQRLGRTGDGRCTAAETHPDIGHRAFQPLIYRLYVLSTPHPRTDQRRSLGGEITHLYIAGAEDGDRVGIMAVARLGAQAHRIADGRGEQLEPPIAPRLVLIGKVDSDHGQRQFVHAA